MKINIEIEVTADGYDMVVKQDGKQIEHTKHQYEGNGMTTCVVNENSVDDYELDDKLDDISMALDGIMYYIQEGEEAEEEDDE